ncbi:MAG: NAD+ synthase [Piscirickettsiaceae bacterium]|nr:NAD+ synthase [Piscirickettsiaceae bacterium]
MNNFCLVIGQINLVVGDISGNVRRIIAASEEARDILQADLIVFPELTLTGYPPEDLLLRPDIMIRVNQGLNALKKYIVGVGILIGHPEGEVRGKLYNAASLIFNGKCLARYFKHRLPNYSVFDERRYFIEGNVPSVIKFKGIKFGITICEDIWFSEPAVYAADSGAEVILNLNASPFRQGKSELREAEVKQRTLETGLPIIYINLVGGQDDLVFDGHSFALSSQGLPVARAPAFQQVLFPLLLNRDVFGQIEIKGNLAKKEDDVVMVYQALVQGLQDYIEKNKFPSVVMGLSGGIDSALTLILAVDAIGAKRVKTVMMPSRHTSQMSLDDAEEMAKRVRVSHDVLSIEPMFNQFLETLVQTYADSTIGAMAENIQARCRGVLLMAISNNTGAMLLSTGNKSEMAVGYSTLYGDMAGGYAPLKDVYKTLVYKLCRYRNSISNIIPECILNRPPSAELSSGQCDQDSLPDYEVLDRILEYYIANDWCYEDIVFAGNDAEIVARVIGMVDRNEYKRRQAPPGICITSRAFGRDRRYPITSGYNITEA